MAESPRRGHRRPRIDQRRKADDQADPTDLYPDLPQVGAPPGGGLDEVTDVDDRGKKRVVEQAPLVTGVGNDVGQLTKIKFRVDGNGDQERLVASLAPADMIQSGHGFMIDNCRSRPLRSETAP